MTHKNMQFRSHGLTLSGVDGLMPARLPEPAELDAVWARVPRSIRLEMLKKWCQEEGLLLIPERKLP